MATTRLPFVAGNLEHRESPLAVCSRIDQDHTPEHALHRIESGPEGPTQKGLGTGGFELGFSRVRLRVDRRSLEVARGCSRY